MEYVSGDPMLIKNIVTQLKSQGIFDQFRKECIADVDTKPAYQNLGHLADTQVAKYLSKVKWGSDLNKNQVRENIRRHVNKSSFVEPGIAIIVDQLVNPRINTVLVPKVEDMLYKYLGIPRPPIIETSHEEDKSEDKPTCNDVPDNSVRATSTQDTTEKKKDIEKTSIAIDISKPQEIETDYQKSESKSAITSKTSISVEKNSRDVKSNVKTEVTDSFRESGKSKPTELPKQEFKIEQEEPAPPGIQDIESSDDEMSPPYEPNEKSDDMSIGSGDSNYSEIIDPKTIETDIPIETEIENICQSEELKVVPEHEDSMDSVRSQSSMHSVPEKVTISPLDIPKTPNIHYETSDESDDYLKKKPLDTVIPVDPRAEPLDIPEVNFDKIVEKVIEDNTDDVKLEKIDIVAESKPTKDEDGHKSRDENRSDDAKKKYKHKDDKMKSADKEKHDKKHEYHSSKDRKHDKYKSDHKSKDRDKDKSKHDSKTHRKDDKPHHSKERDHKTDQDKKSKIEPKKDDRKDRSDHKKEDKSEHKKEDRKHDDDRKYSKDDKDRKKDSRKSTSDDKRSKSKHDDSKHKYDKSRDDRKSKNSDHHKNKKKDEDLKKSRSHCNSEEKKKTDRRSSDRDSSGPSAPNSSVYSSIYHSTKSDKDKGSRHRHSSSSSSSYKTKKNDTEQEKDRNRKSSEHKDADKNLVDKMNEDDLEMILEASPEKAYHPNLKADVHFTKILNETTNRETKSDHIEDMMNEMFQSSVSSESLVVKESPKDIETAILKKPKIAKNFADIRRIMKLRKLYKESMRIKEEQGKENNVGSPVKPTDDEKILNQMKLRKTVDYFVTKRFGKNGSNLEKCKELTNAIMETLTDVQLNITRVDRQYPIVDGCCLLNEEKKLDEADRIFNNNYKDDKNLMIDEMKKLTDEVENLPIIHDEQANLVLEDLAKSYKVENSSDGEKSDDKLLDLDDSEKALQIINSCSPETKANGAKKRLTTPIKPKYLDDDVAVEEPKLDLAINLEDIIGYTKTTEITYEQDTPTKQSIEDSPRLKFKFKSTYDGKNKTWHACDQADDDVFYLPSPTSNDEFKQFVQQLTDESFDINVENLSIEMEYPESFDDIFTSQLGAKVTRKKVFDDAKTSPIKYNSEIISKKMGDKSIMLRIKKSSESEEQDVKKVKKRKANNIENPAKLANHSCEEETLYNKKVPLKRKNENVRRKTLGIKRSLVGSVTDDSFNLKLTEQSISSDDTPEVKNGSIELKSSVKKTPKRKTKITKEEAIANANHKKSESESSDGRRSSISSSGNNTHCRSTIETMSSPTATKTKKTANDSKTETTVETEITATMKATDQSKKANDTKSLEERRKQSIMNCYYDESDLYKPRPSLRLTSRRYRSTHTENT